MTDDFSRQVKSFVTKTVMDLIQSERFAEWYGESGQFDSFLRGDDEFTRHQIEEQLAKMLFPQR